MLILTVPVAGAFDDPDILARCSVKADDLLGISVQTMPVELALVIDRRGGMAELDVELAKAFLGIELPDLLAVES